MIDLEVSIHVCQPFLWLDRFTGISKAGVVVRITSWILDLFCPDFVADPINIYTVCLCDCQVRMTL
jgi:hypothetical protein